MTIVATVVTAILTFAALPAWADAPNASQTVEIKGVRNPELASYRLMRAGLDAFDQYRELAPEAPELRYRLRGRSGVDTSLDGLQLKISGDNTSIELPLAADHSFLLPRSRQAEDDNADLVLNRPKRDYRWWPDVHSPSVPANMRRLGDLRLECQVLVAVAKEAIGFMTKAMINSLLLTSDWCGHAKVNIATSVPRPLSKATLLSGEQRIELKITDKGYGFQPPLANQAYPDATLIELEYKN